MSEQPSASGLEERVRFMLGDAAERRDFDAILDSYANDAVWVMPTQVFEGIDAIRRHWEEWFESYEDLRFGTPNVTDLGNGVVLAVVRHGGRLRGGTAELSQELALVYEWAGDSVVRVSASFDIDESRAAAQRLVEERA